MKLFSTIIFNLLLSGILCAQNVKTDIPESLVGKNLKQNTIRVNLLTHLADESHIAWSERSITLAQESSDLSPVNRDNNVKVVPQY